MGIWQRRVGLPTGAVHGTRGQWFPWAIAGEEPRPSPAHPPPVAQDLEQLRRQHDVPVFLSLSLLDAEHHPLAIDRGRGQVDGFGNAEAGGVADGEDGSMLTILHTLEEVHDFRGAEHNRQGLDDLRCGQHGLDGPRLRERHRVEEPQRRDGDVDRARCQAFLGGQIDLIRTNLLRTQEGRRPAEVAGEPGDVLDIGTLRGRRQIPNLHVFEHPLAKRGHGGLLGNSPGAFQACGRSVCEAGDQIRGRIGRGSQRRASCPNRRVIVYRKAV